MLLDGINLQLKLLSDCYFHSIKSKKRSWFAFIVYSRVFQTFFQNFFKMKKKKQWLPPLKLLKNLPLKTPKIFFCSLSSSPEYLVLISNYDLMAPCGPFTAHGPLGGQVVHFGKLWFKVCSTYF